jgi:hypothetical protein
LAVVTNELAYKTAVLRLTVKNIVPTLTDNLIKIYLSEFINSSLKARLAYITKENVYIYETAYLTITLWLINYTLISVLH